METFKLIVKTACFISIAAALLDTLYPNEKFEKQMKTLFSLVLLIVIATPFAKGEIVLEMPDYSAIASESYEQSAKNIDDLTLRTAQNNLNATLEAVLRKNEIYSVKIQTSINISDNVSISINEVGIVTDSFSEFEKSAKIIQHEFGQEKILFTQIRSN